MTKPPMPAAHEQDGGHCSHQEQDEEQQALEAQGSQQNQKRRSDHRGVAQQPHLHTHAHAYLQAAG